MIRFTTEARSNFPSPHRFVIQGWNGSKWQDSVHGAPSATEAVTLAQERGETFAMPGTRLRVVERCKAKETT